MTNLTMKRPKAPSISCPLPSRLPMREGREIEKMGLFDEENGKTVLFDEACELQSRLREQLSQVRTEVGLFLRLMYKNKNQHRRSLYYRRLSQVRRDLQLLSSSGLEAIVENLKKFVSAGSSDASRPDVRSKPLLHVVDETKAMHTLLGVARLLNQSYGPMMASSVQLIGLLGQSFFMPFALTMFCCLARFRVVLMQVLYEVVSAFNMLSAVRQNRSKIFPTVLDQSLPGQLECQWDGERLCMTERKVASRPEGGVPCGDTFQESTAAWFVDDRTGTQYDLGAPTTVAGGVLQASNVNKDVKATSHGGKRTDYVGSKLEELSSYSHSFDPKENDTGLSGSDVLHNSENNSQIQDTKVSESFPSLVVMPVKACNGVVEDTHRLESSGKSPSAFTENATSEPILGRREVAKKVAYISVGHKVALDRTNERNVTQNSRDGTVRDVQQDMKAKVMEVSVSDNKGRVNGDGGVRSPPDVIVPVGRMDGRYTGRMSSLNSGDTETMEEVGTSRKELKDLHPGMTDAFNQENVTMFNKLESAEGGERTKVLGAAAEFVGTQVKDDKRGDDELLADTTTSVNHLDVTDTTGVYLKESVDHFPEDSGRNHIRVDRVRQEFMARTPWNGATDMYPSAVKSMESDERTSTEAEVIAEARGRTIDEGPESSLSSLKASTCSVRGPSEANFEKPIISNSSPQGKSEEIIEFSMVREEANKATSPRHFGERGRHHNALDSNKKDLVDAADQTATNSDEPRSLGKSLTADGKLTKPSEDVSMSPGVRVSHQNKKSSKRKVRFTGDKRKETRQLIGHERDEDTSERRKAKTDLTRTSREREAKKQKTNDIFAMLMGGLK